MVRKSTSESLLVEIPYHAVLAKALVDRGHTVHWFAPHGSSEIGIFHPLVLSYGNYISDDSIPGITLDPFPLENFLSFDFIIDMGAAARTLEELFWYHDYKNFCSYRNGYTSYNAPRLKPAEKHSVVPSKQNQRLFSEAGVPARVAHYGIPDFYCPGTNDEYWKWPELEKKSYWLFPHRPTPDKGLHILMNVAESMPQETFVVAGTTPITEHLAYLNQIKLMAAERKMTNLKFISLPVNPKHHYYKRELMRNAKGIMSPLGPDYFEGFGLTNGEAIACGIPCLMSDGESARELWRNEVDGLLAEGVTGFQMAIKHWSSYNFHPENRYFVTDMAKRYETIAAEIMLS